MFVVALSLALIAAAEDPAVLVVAVGPLESNEGTVRCSLYATKDGYPGDPGKARAKVTAKISNKRATCEFPNLAPGTYAVATYHDEDGDGELDSNFIGIPSEGVGTSNDAKGSMGPPSFEDARFKYAGGTQKIAIAMTY